MECLYGRVDMTAQLSRLVLHDQVPLPSVLIEHLQKIGVDAPMRTFCGLFKKLLRAWVTVDDVLFSWNAVTGDDFQVYRNPGGIILATEAVVPRPGVLVATVSHLIVVTSLDQISLLAVIPDASSSPASIGVLTHGAGPGSSTAAQMYHAAQAQRINVESTPFRCSSDGIAFSAISSTAADGRIFLTSVEGVLYELEYGTDVGCRLRNLSNGFFSFLIPSFLRRDNGPAIDTVADRSSVYVLHQNSVLAIWKSGKRVEEMHVGDIQAAGLGMTDTVLRIFSEDGRWAELLLEPASGGTPSTQLRFRPAPPQMRASASVMTAGSGPIGPIALNFHSFFVSRDAAVTLMAARLDEHADRIQLAGTGSSVDIEGRTRDMMEITTASYPRRFFLAITGAGLFLFKQRSAAEVLQMELESAHLQGPSMTTKDRLMRFAAAAGIRQEEEVCALLLSAIHFSDETGAPAGASVGAGIGGGKTLAAAIASFLPEVRSAGANIIAARMLLPLERLTISDSSFDLELAEGLIRLAVTDISVPTIKECVLISAELIKFCVFIRQLLGRRPTNIRFFSLLRGDAPTAAAAAPLTAPIPSLEPTRAMVRRVLKETILSSSDTQAPGARRTDRSGTNAGISPEQLNKLIQLCPMFFDRSELARAEAYSRLVQGQYAEAEHLFLTSACFLNVEEAKEVSVLLPHAVQVALSFVDRPGAAGPATVSHASVQQVKDLWDSVILPRLTADISLVQVIEKSTQNRAVHFLLYDFLLCVGEYRPLLLRIPISPGTYVVEFLKMEKMDEVLAEYYHVHGRYAEAAMLYMTLAQSTALVCSLNKRIEYLQTGLAAARLVSSSSSGTELLLGSSSAVAVAAAGAHLGGGGDENLARQIYDLLQTATEVQLEAVKECRDEHAREELNSRLFDVSVLYHQFLVPHRLFKSCLATLHVTQSRVDEQIVERYWSNALEADPGCFEELVLKYSMDPFVFPLERIVPLVEILKRQGKLLSANPEHVFLQGGRVEPRELWTAYWKWFAKFSARQAAALSTSTLATPVSGTLTPSTGVASSADPVYYYRASRMVDVLECIADVLEEGAVAALVGTPATRSSLVRGLPFVDQFLFEMNHHHHLKLSRSDPLYGRLARLLGNF